MKFYTWLFGMLGTGLLLAGMPETRNFAIVCAVLMLVVLWTNWHDSDKTDRTM